jgi:hypothetical protein
MTPWFTPPIVIPLGLILMIIALVIYQASVRPAGRTQAAAVRSSSDTASAVELSRQWRA